MNFIINSCWKCIKYDKASISGNLSVNEIVYMDSGPLHEVFLPMTRWNKKFVRKFLFDKKETKPHEFAIYDADRKIKRWKMLHHLTTGQNGQKQKRLRWGKKGSKKVPVWEKGPNPWNIPNSKWTIFVFVCNIICFNKLP